MNSLDAGQYRYMREQLEEYERGERNIDQLISGLDLLLSVLKEPDTDWVRRFRRIWYSIEVAYALASENGDGTSVDVFRSTQPSRDALLKLVDEALSL